MPVVEVESFISRERLCRGMEVCCLDGAELEVKEAKLLCMYRDTS